MNYVSMNEILEYIDREYDYGVNADVVDFMQNIQNNSKDKHLIVRKTFFKYLNSYIRRKYNLKTCNNTTYLDYIDHNGRGTKGARYNFDQIKEFLNDEITQEKLKKQLFEKTTFVGDIRVPDCVLTDFNNQQDAYLYKGYSLHQLKIASMPDEMLLEKKEKLEWKLAKLKTQLKLVKTELFDINQELDGRPPIPPEHI